MCLILSASLPGRTTFSYFTAVFPFLRSRVSRVIRAQKNAGSTARVQTVKKPRRVRCVSSEKGSNCFRPRRTPGWLLLPLRGNSPSVRGRKHFSGCKCGICSPMANKLCAQQTAKTGGKARRGFSTSSTRAALPASILPLSLRPPQAFPLPWPSSRPPP